MMVVIKSNDRLIHAYLSFPQDIPNLLPYLLKVFLTDILLQDEKNLLPLHRVILEDETEIHVLITILNGYPDATAMKTCPITTFHNKLHHYKQVSTSLPLVMAINTQRFSLWYVLI